MTLAENQMTNGTQKPQANAAIIENHLKHMTARWPELGAECLFEVRFLTDDDKAAVKDISRFHPDADGIAQAVQHISAMNAHRLNAYVVVNPIDASADIQAGKGAKDEDIVGSFFHWADADDALAASNIQAFVGPRPTFYVMTGTAPCQRPHVYWELEEPTRNLKAWETTQKAIAATLLTDPSVTNPSRIMRVAGTINWPKPQKLAKGYVVEGTALHIHDQHDRPLTSSERMARAFVPVSTEPSAPFRIQTGIRQQKDASHYADILRRARTDGEKHTGVRDLTACLAGSGVPRALTEAIVSEACPVNDDGVIKLIDSAYDNFYSGAFLPGGEAAQPEAWAEPDITVIRPERPPAPVMEDHEFAKVFGPWAKWITDAAEVKGAPVDFVALALLSTASAIIGNTRWAVPWDGWKEPPIIWGMLVGDPSSGKSPALDAVLDPIKQIDNALSAEYIEARDEWASKDEVARLVAAKWKSDAKAAIAEGEEPPEKPKEADAGSPPIRGRIRITDTTTEKAADLVRDGWRGLLLSRDELSGWLASMDRYSGGGDRPFWLEAFGGRSYTVDRKGSPEPVIVDHLSIAVLGGTQPDKLDSLLVHSDDDGLLARYLVTFPAPPPLRRPETSMDTLTAQTAFERLRKLEPIIDDVGEKRPYFLFLDEPAQEALQEFRKQCREWEAEASGLMKSHIGKLPGLAVRTATVLALLDYAYDGQHAPTSIGAAHIGRACHYVGEHMRQHAHRAYGAASVPPELRAASRIAEIIKAEGLREISTREIQRRGLVGLQTAKEIGPAFAALQGASWIAPVQQPSGPGRPAKIFAVNPRLEGQQ